MLGLIVTPWVGMYQLMSWPGCAKVIKPLCHLAIRHTINFMLISLSYSESIGNMP